MIEYINGDLTEAPEYVIVHGCNAQGVMGSGVALAIRQKWAYAYHAYRRVYIDHSLRVGQIVPAVGDKFIINAITQEYYGRDPNVVYVDYDAIRNCMRQIAKIAPVMIECVVAMPKIGAGLGNGDWKIIEKIILEEMMMTDVDGNRVAIDVKVYEL